MVTPTPFNNADLRPCHNLTSNEISVAIGLVRRDLQLELKNLNSDKVVRAFNELIIEALEVVKKKILDGYDISKFFHLIDNEGITCHIDQASSNLPAEIFAEISPENICKICSLATRKLKEIIGLQNLADRLDKSRRNAELAAEARRDTVDTLSRTGT